MSEQPEVDRRVVLRRVRSADAEALSALAVQVGLCLQVESDLAQEATEFWLAEREEEPRVLGFALGAVVADELEVSDVGVRPEVRERGLGSLLLAKLLEQAAARGAQRAFLEVRASNQAAQALYRKFGFVRVGERRAYYADGEDAWLLSALARDFRDCSRARLG